MVVEIITSNLWEYGILTILSLYFLLTLNKEFSKEGLIDYCIYLTTKILLFVVSFTFLIIFSITLIDGIQQTTENFLKEFINQVLIYGFFNYGLFYFLKFWGWIYDIAKKNDLYNLKFFKEIGGKEK